MKNLKHLGETLSKTEQKSINGGSTCQIPAAACLACGGHPVPGDCIGPPGTHTCLRDDHGITC